MKDCICTLMSALILAVVIFLFDSVYHGFLLSDSYIKTAHLWRSGEEMGKYFPFNIAIYLVSSILIVTLFKKFVLISDKKLLLYRSFEFGLIFGSLIGLVLLGFYAYMPIGLGLAFAWFFGSFLHGVIIASILYLLYRNHV